MPPSPPAELEQDRKQQIIGIVGVGCSLRTAAEFIGSSVEAIRRAADRDPRFAEDIRRARRQSEVVYAQQIRRAAAQDRYWRAAAWALERRNPEDFASRRPDDVNPSEIRPLLMRIAEVLVEEIDDDADRRRILDTLKTLIAETTPS